MPRPQRGRRHRLRPAAHQPYRRGDRRRAGAGAGLHTNGTCLPDDALAAIFTRLRDTADVVRCAATCARWACVVATSAAPLSRSLPPPCRFLPQLAVGFFCQENDRFAARTRGSLARFLAMAMGTATGTGGSRRRLLGCHHRSGIGSLFANHGDDLDLDGGEALDYSRLVASRSGRLVVELQRRRRAGLTFCVCNPITGDVSVLPPLPGKDTDDMPVSYACTLLTGDDLDPTSSSRFFRLLLVYNRRPGVTVLRCYASDTGNWGPEAVSSVDVSDHELRHVGPAVVLRGVAFWPLDHGAIGVRLELQQDPRHQATMALHAHLLPYDMPHYWPEKRLLGVSPDGRLFFMHFSIRAGLYILCAKISYFEMQGGDFRTGKKESSSFEQGVLMHQMKMMNYRDTSLKLRWFGEESGIVLFTMAESSGQSGTFALNLRDETVQKVTAGGEGDQWGQLVGFEMDREAYLALLAHGVER